MRTTRHALWDTATKDTGATRMLFATATASPQSAPINPISTISRIRPMPGFKVDALVAMDVGKEDGLSSAWNTVLDSNSASQDIVVLSHDDLTIADARVYDVLSKCRNEGWDVIGLCGGKAWHPPVMPDQRNGWNKASGGANAGGIVHHDIEGSTTFHSSYGGVHGSVAEEVLTIDGCFIALMNRGLELRFDPIFKFHLYDMDVCMTAFRKGMRVGVANILCEHSSLGKGILTDEYMEAQRLFTRKWFSIG